MTSQLQTPPRVFAYLRASTKEQDATRARTALEKFAADKGLTIHAEYVENESGASLNRPELFALIKAAAAGDIILIEQVDRLSRLNDADWKQLRRDITSKGIKVVSLDLPTSHILATQNADEFTSRMHEAINGMMLDMLAAVARKDYSDRRRRQIEGIHKAQAQGKYKGRPVDTEKQERIYKLVDAGMSQREAAATLGCGLSTVVAALRRRREAVKVNIQDA